MNRRDIPRFPDIGCAGDCGFEKRGIGFQCVDGTACQRYVHPGDMKFDELAEFHKKMIEFGSDIEGDD